MLEAGLTSAYKIKAAGPSDQAMDDGVAITDTDHSSRETQDSEGFDGSNPLLAGQANSPALGGNTNPLLSSEADQRSRCALPQH